MYYGIWLMGGYGILDHKTCGHSSLINTKDSTETVVFVSQFHISEEFYGFTFTESETTQTSYETAWCVCSYY